MVGGHHPQIHLQLYQRLPLLGERGPHTSLNVPLPALHQPQSPSWDRVGTLQPPCSLGLP